MLVVFSYKSYYTFGEVSPFRYVKDYAMGKKYHLLSDDDLSFFREAVFDESAKVFKWEKRIKFSVPSEVSDEFAGSATHLFQKLGEVTGQRPLRVDNVSDANFAVLIGDVSPDIEAELGMVLKSWESNNCSIHVSMEPSGKIIGAIFFLRSSLSLGEIQRCFAEPFVRSFGLFGIVKHPESVLYKGSQSGTISQIDIVALRLLYSSTIVSGLSKNDAISVLGAQKSIEIK